jgi:hypothetical protein
MLNTSRRASVQKPLPYLAVSRGGHKYVFRYEEGNEGKLITTLLEYADNPELNLTWLDVLLILRKLND